MGTERAAAQASSLDEKTAREQLVEALEVGTRHGLARTLFLKDDPANADVAALRDAVLGLAGALANGKVDPAKLHEVYTLPRPKVDVGAGFEKALQEEQLAEWLESLVPQSAEYKAISAAFVQLAQRVPDLRDQSIPAEGGAIREGSNDPRVPAIAQNLRAQGYLPPAAGQQGSETFTPELANALRQWQTDHGLKADGVIGSNTIGQLNDGPKDRARKLAIAMERLRWLGREAPSTRIDVNTAAAFLEYYRDGQRVDQRLVVVGEPGWETPPLGSPITALVANPDWVVPDSIVEEEISKKSGAWLRQNDFTRKNGRWVQEPGPKSALGLVKFAMANDQAIYLHDTPSKAAFGREERHESHGCVRVQNAVQFAEMIARQEGISDQFAAARKTGEEKQVELPREIPVRLLYHTAFLGSDNRIRFAEDAYGWDNELAVALGYERREMLARKPKRGSDDVGP